MLLYPKAGYNNKADIWSLGCIAYELFTGKKPFSRDFEVHQYWASKGKSVSLALPDSFQQFIVRDLLQLDPSRRPPARDILNLKFITGHKFTPSLSTNSPVPKDGIVPHIWLHSAESRSLNELTFRWALSVEQLDVILSLVHAGADIVACPEILILATRKGRKDVAEALRVVGFLPEILPMTDGGIGFKDHVVPGLPTMLSFIVASPDVNANHSPGDREIDQLRKEVDDLYRATREKANSYQRDLETLASRPTRYGAESNSETNQKVGDCGSSAEV